MTQDLPTTDKNDDDGLNWPRIAGMTFVIAVHAAALMLLLAPVTPPGMEKADTDTTRVVIIEPPPPPPPPPPDCAKAAPLMASRVANAKALVVFMALSSASGRGLRMALLFEARRVVDKARTHRARLIGCDAAHALRAIRETAA